MDIKTVRTIKTVYFFDDEKGTEYYLIKLGRDYLLIKREPTVEPTSSSDFELKVVNLGYLKSIGVPGMAVGGLCEDRERRMNEEMRGDERSPGHLAVVKALEAAHKSLRQESLKGTGFNSYITARLKDEISKLNDALVEVLYFLKRKKRNQQGRK